MGVYDQHVAEVGSGKYFKPKAGVNYILKIASEPVIFDNVFDDANKGPQISTKYAWVVFNLTDDVAQILQLPGGAYNTLANIARPDGRWGDPLDGKYDIEYTRTGAMKDTKHSLVPVPADGPLTSEQQEKVDAIDLLESIKVGKGVERPEWLAKVVERQGARLETNLGQKLPTAPPLNDDEPIDPNDIPF